MCFVFVCLFVFFIFISHTPASIVREVFAFQALNKYLLTLLGEK